MKKLDLHSLFWGISFVCSLAISFSFGYKNLDLDNLLNIQFSDSLNEFMKLVNCEVYQNLINNTFVDFIFILFYTSLFFFSLKVFNYTLSLKLKLGSYLTALLPGVFDLVENVIFLKLIDPDFTSNQEWYYSIYFLSVRLKWFFVLFFAIITFTILYYYIIYLINKILD